MSYHFHILTTARLARPWWRTDERFAETAGTKVWTDCCGCKMPADQTDCRLVETWDPPACGDLGCYQEPTPPWEKTPSGRKSRSRWAKPYVPTGAYYDPTLDVRCAEGFGCTVNPRKKAGRALREMWRFGA